MDALPILLIGAFIVVWMLVSSRNRRRTAASEVDRRSRLRIGTDVMTTSGLYGTITEMDDDDTAMLSIAPGVEVRWQVAALRDSAALPAQYRGSLDEHAAEDAEAAGMAAALSPADVTVVDLKKSSISSDAGDAEGAATEESSSAVSGDSTDLNRPVRKTKRRATGELD